MWIRMCNTSRWFTGTIRWYKGKGKKKLKRHGKYLHTEICLFAKRYEVISKIYLEDPVF